MLYKLFKSSLILLVISLIISCASENAPSKIIPILTTSTISNITLNSASSGGNVTNDGGDSVIARGIIWNTTTAPTIDLSTKTTDGTGIGNFSSSITNLIPSSTYFVRAYATNSIGTAYGNELSFTTGAIVLPTVSTTTITNITTNSAVSGGNITADGGGTITSRGIVWSTTQNPTIILTTKTTDGAGIGNFLSNLTNLEQNTSYFVKAYATNSAGTAYGNQVEFKTNAVPITVIDADGNVYKTIQIGNQLWMAENLKTTKYCNGDVIPNVTDDIQWSAMASGAWVYYNDDIKNNSIYGKLYNWFTASDIRNPCPCNWRVPSKNDWIILSDYLGGYAIAGMKMKSTGSIESGNGYWYTSNYSGTNSSGFNGLPGGNISEYNLFSQIGFEGGWWSSTQWSSAGGWTYGDYSMVSKNFQDLYISSTHKEVGQSIRCIKN